jgi:hypothetical protein
VVEGVQKIRHPPRPSEFILDLMKQIFGERQASRLNSMHLKLALSTAQYGFSVYSSPEASDKESSDKVSLDSGAGTKYWIPKDWEKKHKGDKW